MKTVLAVLAASRYWTDPQALEKAYGDIQEHLRELDAQTYLICTEADLEKLPQGDCAVLVPISGAVQPLMLKIAQKYDTVALYAAYVRGNLPGSLADMLLMNNAAPAIMDTWAVLKRTHAHVEFSMTREELFLDVRVLSAWKKIQRSKLILVGATEPWVISNSENIHTYEKLGFTVEQVSQDEVAQQFRITTDREAEEFYRYFRQDAKKVVEPTEAHIMASARMAKALTVVMERHHADAMALACFNLLKEGTNCCLGVSFINDCTDCCAGCEGDLDSTVTMYAMKQLASTRLWMANPGLHPGGVINFSHCTAPLHMKGEHKQPYILRSHHESGIGTSLQVEFPIGQTVTMCRISDQASVMTVQKGVTVEGEYECACRTQVYVRMDDFDHYLQTALGCHQIFAFEDLEKPMRKLAKHLGLKVL